MAAPRRPWSEPRRRLVAVGLTAVVLHVVVTTFALTGLMRVQDAHAAVEALDTAQAAFQDADMAHDAVRASAAAVLLDLARQRRNPDAPDDLRRDVADFRRHLDDVDEVELPASLDGAVQGVRPLQDTYLQVAVRMAGTTDAAVAREVFEQVEVQAEALVEEQDDVTRALEAEADRLRTAAREDERVVGLQLLLSAVGALVALVGVTVLLSRMGRDLTALLARERGVAETLQQTLLPQSLPDLPGVQFAARYVASAVGTQVGGDWYDVLPLPGGRVGLVMGDVVGHDLRAAASMGQLRNALRACAADGSPPADVLHRLNHLSVTQQMGDMASVLYAVLDPVQGVVEVANAGHLPPLLLTPDERCFLEAAPSPPVGVVREAAFTSTVWRVPPGSLLLLFTDGLVERRGAPLEQRLDRLLDVAEAVRGTPLEQVCDTVLAQLQGGASEDDVALLVVAPQALLGPRVEVTWPASAERLALLRVLLERWLAEVGASDDELYDVLVAASEAATNAVEHAYGPAGAEFRVTCEVEDGSVTVVVRDWGRWREPRGTDRGRGLALMEGLMDEVQVSHSTTGTEVRLRRRLRHCSVPAERQPASR